jgi:hypothetical protein
VEAELLKQILAELKIANSREPLGFFSSARTFVYLNRTKCDGYLWYTRDNDINTGIPERSLRGTIMGFAWETVQRKERPTTKVRLRIKADRDYVLEAGLESNAGQSLVKSLYALRQTEKPIVLSVSPGTSESVMFVGISVDGQRVKTGSDEVEEDMLRNLSAWYPDRLFYHEESDDSDTHAPAPTAPASLTAKPDSAYQFLVRKLADLGVWPQWQKWAVDSIAESGQTPDTLTLEVATALASVANNAIKSQK